MTPHEIILTIIAIINILFFAYNRLEYRNLTQLRDMVNKGLAKANNTMDKYHKELAETRKKLIRLHQEFNENH